MLAASLQRKIISAYRATWGMALRFLSPDGVSVDAAHDPLGIIPVVIEARRHALHESLRWGEAYTFLLTDGVMCWAVALMHGDALVGGLCGEEVAVEGEGTLDIPAAGSHLGHGEPFRRRAIERYLKHLPRWTHGRIRAAADDLATLAYAMTGLRSDLWKANRANALQQRQIAEAIHAHKGLRETPSLVADEKALLQLIRARDTAGSRRRINDILAGLFLDAPAM
ncbi:MAG: hypothetical protein FWF84_04320, partial [Kiritimatiellaeota bacterium]|nr:hypothetical protein [Kiritimatiellota bacterium]